MSLSTASTLSPISAACHKIFGMIENKMAEEIIKHDRKKKQNGTSNKHTLKTLFQPFGLFSPDMACIPPRVCIACCPLQHYSVLARSLNTFTTIFFNPPGSTAKNARN